MGRLSLWSPEFCHTSKHSTLRNYVQLRSSYRYLISNEKAFCLMLLRHIRLGMPEKLGHCVVCTDCWLLNSLGPDFCHCINSGDEFSGIGIHMTGLKSCTCAVGLVQVWHSSVCYCVSCGWVAQSFWCIKTRIIHPCSLLKKLSECLGMWGWSWERPQRTVTSPCFLVVSSLADLGF